MPKARLYLHLHQILGQRQGVRYNLRSFLRVEVSIVQQLVRVHVFDPEVYLVMVQVAVPILGTRFCVVKAYS